MAVRPREASGSSRGRQGGTGGSEEGDRKQSERKRSGKRVCTGVGGGGCVRVYVTPKWREEEGRGGAVAQVVTGEVCAQVTICVGVCVCAWEGGGSRRLW